MPRLLEIAMRTAIEKRGVAVLVMADDTALEDAVDDRVFTVRRTDPVIVPPGGAAGGSRHAELLWERSDPRRRTGSCNRNRATKTVTVTSHSQVCGTMFQPSTFDTR